MFRLALLAVAFATPVMADPESYGRMMDWHDGHGLGLIFGPVLWLVVLGLVVAGVIWLVRRTDNGSPQQSKSNATAELDMRFARGEIDAEDYATRKKLLAG